MRNLVPVCLPKILQPKECNLIRLGNDNDGGYLVCREDIEKSQVLLSLGISDDWTFEADYSKKTRNGILAFDGAITMRFWLKKILAAVFHRNPKKICDWYRQSKFFSGKHILVNMFVGFSQHERGFISFKEIFDIFPEQITGKAVYLKVDIEGWEYRILDDLVYFAPCLTGLAIEFHDVDLNLAKIESFVNSFPMNVVHVHANNFGYRLNNGIPTVIEVTFSKHAKSSNAPSLPHFLDAPNDPNAPDYSISFH